MTDMFRFVQPRAFGFTSGSARESILSPYANADSTSSETEYAARLADLATNNADSDPPGVLLNAAREISRPPSGLTAVSEPVRYLAEDAMTARAGGGFPDPEELEEAARSWPIRGRDDPWTMQRLADDAGDLWLWMVLHSRDEQVRYSSRVAMAIRSLHHHTSLLETGRDDVRNALKAESDVSKAAVWNGLVGIGVLAELLPADQTPIEAVGWGDLMVVRRHALRYAAADIAHIENVMASETRSRTHSRVEEKETTTVEETETSSASERDLESTEKYSLDSETERQQRRDDEFTLGSTVSGKYGKQIDFKVEAGYEGIRSSEQSSSSAQSYAKDVTERSKKSLQERRLDRRTERQRIEVSEKNVHEFENSTGDHIVGIYRRVEKVSCAHVVNYGLRLLFDFVVQEPAAHLKWLRTKGVDAEIAERPVWNKTRQKDESGSEVWVDLERQHLNEELWPSHAAYRGIEVDPPPPAEVSVTDVVTHKWVKPETGLDPIETSTGMTHPAAMSGTITVPDGYVAKRLHFSLTGFKPRGGNTAFPKVVVGRLPEREVETGTTFELNTDDASKDLQLWTGEIAFGVQKFTTLASFAMTVEAECERTESAFRTWQVRVFNELRRAYERDVGEHERKLREREESVSLLERLIADSPDRNRDIMIAELQKQCIDRLAGSTHFHDQFDAVKELSGEPQPDLAESRHEGELIRFLQHAFEWEHMTYVMYPYHWARESKWPELLNAESQDRVFSAFMNAGAVRVVVPVRPSFADAVAFFQVFGEPWLGDEWVGVDHPLYLSIADEIRARSGDHAHECQVGDAWLVREPTDLIVLDGEPLPVLSETCPPLDQCE